ncbi:low-complexity tail membrane protein [Microcoleus sp. FACHB-1515]|uniref:low-complexity tail membrane protein n=1 Tax=Cyanophyceae TaxID=3028117 RepID=UPI0016850B1C|nr:low-complexity tail membrane protein [Microcoleus sp. FACHB-1515]MBD2089420.1 low-complexity tail membrane protein [Microcoleus sp. FACHB-1515]
MRSFWSDPYLWIHLAGVAVLPLTLELCLLGLAIGDPIFPPIVERLIVLTIGIVPIFLMQWQRPFYIFSVLLVAIRPEYLTIDQRRILKRFKTLGHQILTLLVAIGLGAVLLQLYQIAPLVLQPAAQFPQWRGLGLLIASGGFLLSNLFLQVSLSVLRVLLIKETEFALIDVYPIEQIRSNFSIFGWQIKQIVPPLTEAQTLAMAAAAAAVPSAVPARPPSVAAPVSAAQTEAIAEQADPAPSIATDDEPALADLVAAELTETVTEATSTDLEEAIETDAIASEAIAANDPATSDATDQPEQPIV